MGIARLAGETYRVALAETPAVRSEIQALRAVEYARAQPYLRASDAYDDRSFVFGCWADRERRPVATCRFTPSRFELDDLATGWTAPPVPAQALLETSRVVVAVGHRATGLVEVMLTIAGSWLLSNTGYRYNFAVCARPLVRLYARLGMQLTADRELALRGRPVEKRYVVIYGDMATAEPRALERLERAGWNITLDSPEQKVGT